MSKDFPEREEITEKIKKIFADEESMKIIEQFSRINLRRVDLQDEINSLKSLEREFESMFATRNNIPQQHAFIYLMNIDIETVKREKEAKECR